MTLSMRVKMLNEFKAVTTLRNNTLIATLNNCIVSSWQFFFSTRLH